MSSIFKSILDNTYQLDLPPIYPLHGRSTYNKPSSDSFNFETDFDPSSFEDHILETSEDLSVVDSKEFEEETSIFIPEERSASAIVEVIQENTFGTLYLRLYFLISMKTSMINFNLCVLKLPVLPFILPV